MALLAGVGALFGIGQSIYNNIQDRNQSNKLKKAQQDFLDEQERNQRKDRERIESRSPVADQLRQEQILEKGREGAVSQASNVGGGQVANSGLGGDVSSQNIGAAKASAPIVAASGQYDSAIANTIGQRQQAQANQSQQLNANTNTGVNIESQRLYTQDAPQPGLFSNVLSGAVAGANAFDNIKKLGLGGDETASADGTGGGLQGQTIHGAPKPGIQRQNPLPPIPPIQGSQYGQARNALSTDYRGNNLFMNNRMFGGKSLFGKGAY